MEVWPEGSGNAAIAGRELPASEVIAIDQRLTAIARKLKEAGVPGGMDELRLMAYTALLMGRDLDSLVPRAADSDRGREPLPTRWRPAPGELDRLSGSVNLTMPLATWLGDSAALRARWPDTVRWRARTAATSLMAWRPGRTLSGA